MRKGWMKIILIVLCGGSLLLGGCGEKVQFRPYEPQIITSTERQESQGEERVSEDDPKKQNSEVPETVSEGLQDNPEQSMQETDIISEDIDEEETEETEETSTENDEPTPPAQMGSHAGKLIVIDAGHQAKGNKEKEPVGPGAETMKAKVSSGTRGVSTGIPEYELTLTIAKKLEEELLGRGYEVIMVRTTHEVDISNSERAKVANDAGADAFIRIHANGSNDPKVHGAETICQTADNPYNGGLAAKSKELSERVLDCLVSETGCKRRKVWETDTMSGINWCQVPVTIVEMGYMSNAREDELLSEETYQNKIVKGIADGIDLFLD